MRAGRDVCDGLEIGVDADQRFTMGRDTATSGRWRQKMWATMMRTLQEIGALPEGPIAVKYVYRHGKRIAIDTINAGTPAKKRKPFEVRFVKLPNFWIERWNGPTIRERLSLPTGY